MDTEAEDDYDARNSNFNYMNSTAAEVLPLILFLLLLPLLLLAAAVVAAVLSEATWR